MSSFTRTDAADRARNAAIRMMIAASSKSSDAGASSKSARRFAPPSTEQPTTAGTLLAEVRALSCEDLNYLPASATDELWGTQSLGSIRLDPERLNPEHGLMLVRVYATWARHGMQQLPLDLVDDEDDPLRVHLVIRDPSAMQGVATAADATELLLKLQQSMAHAHWALAAEPDFPEVVNIALAVAVTH